jgi:hypothetical protein
VALVAATLLLSTAPAEGVRGALAAGPAPTFLRGLLAVSPETPTRYAVGVAAEDGRAVEVYDGVRLVGRYDNRAFGYGWLYALAAEDGPGERFLAVYADARAARLVRLALGPDGLTPQGSAPLDLSLTLTPERRYELVSVHDLDVGRDGRVFLTGSFGELRRTPGGRTPEGGERAGRPEEPTGRTPTLLVALTLEAGPDGTLRAVVAGGGRCFTVVDPESRHWRVAADRATGHVYTAPRDGAGVLAWRPFPTGFGRAPHRSFTPRTGSIADIAAARGVVAVAAHGGLAPTIDLYERGRPTGRLAGSGGTLAVTFFPGGDGTSPAAPVCGGTGGVLLESAVRGPALATAGGQVTRHRWCETLAAGGVPAR